MNVPRSDAMHNDELSDSELDTILAAVHYDLLAHAHRLADPIEALLAIMENSDADVAAIEITPRPTVDNLVRQRLSVLIEMRHRAANLHDELERVIARARDVAIDLDRALDDRDELVIAFKAARALARHHDRQLARFLGRARDLALTITRDLQRVRELDRELATDHDLAVRRELSIDVNCGPTLDRIRELDRTLNQNRELSIEREIAAARELSVDLERAKRLGHDREIDRELDRSRARQLAIAIDVALFRARELACDVMRRLNAFQVDASGADLSHMRVSDPEILAGVIWTDDTTWPPSVAGRIRVLSCELSAGIYQVRGGGQRYAPDLIAV